MPAEALRLTSCRAGLRPPFAETFAQPDADSIEGALAKFLKRLSGVEVSATDFDAAGLEPHLRANLRLLDGKAVLAESRDLEDLRARFGERAAQAFARHAAQGMATSGLITFPTRRSRCRCRARAAITGVSALPGDDGETVSLALRAQYGERLHPTGRAPAIGDRAGDKS